MHETVNEFLKADPGCAKQEWFRQGDQDIAETCIAYLSLEDFTNAEPELRPRRKDFPFLEYAALNFGIHASKCFDSNPEIQRKSQKFILQEDIPLGSLQMIATRVLHFVSPDRIQSLNYPPLHMAILCGLVRIVESLLNQDVDLEKLGPKWETALHMAARSASVEMVRMILEKGALVNATNYSGKSALDMVMVEPYQDIGLKITTGFFYILAAKIFKPVLDRVHKHLAQEAIDSGRQPIPKLSLDFTVSFETESPSLEDVSKRIKDSERRQDKEHEIMDIILRAGLVMDISDDSAEVVEFLIKHGVDVNSQSCPDVTPLQLAALYNRTELARLLLERGANPFLRRQAKMTALDIAERRKNDEMKTLLNDVMESLLKQEAEISDPTAKLGTFHSRIIIGGLTADAGVDVAGPLQARNLETRAIEGQEARIQHMEDHIREVAARRAPNQDAAGSTLSFPPASMLAATNNMNIGAHSNPDALTTTANLPRDAGEDPASVGQAETLGAPRHPLPPGKRPASLTIIHVLTAGQPPCQTPGAKVRQLHPKHPQSLGSASIPEMP